MHVCALGDLAARRVQRYPSFLLGRIALAQLLTLAVDDADVNGELIADDWTATLSLGEFNPFDLRWQLTTFSHRGDIRTRSDDHAEVTTLPGCALR